MSNTAVAAVETPIGVVGVEVSRAGLRRVRLPGAGEPPAHAPRAAGGLAAVATGQLVEYARGERQAFELPLDWDGVDSTHGGVLENVVLLAPYGVTVTLG